MRLGRHLENLDLNLCLKLGVDIHIRLTGNLESAQKNRRGPT